MQRQKEIIILLAEDDDGHAKLTEHGLKNSGISNEIIRFKNGKEVWEYLTKQNSLDKSYLLLLDIKMPIMDGIEVLEKMKSDDELKQIPVIMLTTTEDPREVENCYKIGCNVYITKPVDFEKFTETLKRLGLFLQVVRF